MSRNVKTTIVVDGSCSGNPGPGGWAAILLYGEAEKVISGGAAMTTNNRMELMAVIAALRALKRPCEVVVVTDSEYVRLALTDGKMKANGDLVEEARQLAAGHCIEVQRVLRPSCSIGSASDKTSALAASVRSTARPVQGVIGKCPHNSGSQMR